MSLVNNLVEKTLLSKYKLGIIEGGGKQKMNVKRPMIKHQMPSNKPGLSTFSGIAKP